MLVLGRVALQHERDLKINWPGRWAVWPTMSAIFLAICRRRRCSAASARTSAWRSTLLAIALYVRRMQLST